VVVMPHEDRRILRAFKHKVCMQQYWRNKLFAEQLVNSQVQQSFDIICCSHHLQPTQTHTRLQSISFEMLDDAFASLAVSISSSAQCVCQ